MSKKTKKWIKAAGIRAVRTFAQTALAMIGIAQFMEQVNWTMTISAALLSGVLSILTSLKGLPEAEE